MFLRVIIFSFYRMVAVSYVQVAVRPDGSLLIAFIYSLNFAIIAEPDEIILTGLSKNNLYNGPIDFVQATSELPNYAVIFSLAYFLSYTVPLVAFLIFGTEKVSHEGGRSINHSAENFCSNSWMCGVSGEDGRSQNNPQTRKRGERIQ